MHVIFVGKKRLALEKAIPKLRLRLPHVSHYLSSFAAHFGLGGSLKAEGLGGWYMFIEKLVLKAQKIYLQTRHAPNKGLHPQKMALNCKKKIELLNFLAKPCLERSRKNGGYYATQTKG